MKKVKRSFEKMETKLKKYFPMIQTKEEVMGKIRESVKMTEMFYSWKNDQQKEFLDFCTGVRGVKLLYDVFLRKL